MKRVDRPEILDSDACSPEEAAAVLQVIAGVNRRFGGVATTQWMIERVAQRTGQNKISLLEVGAGLGELPGIVKKNLAPRGITLDVTLLDLALSHLPRRNGASPYSHSMSGVVANGLALPFADGTFDVISCNLFAHHLTPDQLKLFLGEALRVSRRAVLINDLVRNPLHLALVYVSYPLMRNRVAWLDGLTSVRRAYLPEEIRALAAESLSPRTQIEISRHFLYRMGITLWKS
jgi:ubiquinone/menaquinone biosynthesis C-methylase UbiE